MKFLVLINLGIFFLMGCPSGPSVKMRGPRVIPQIDELVVELKEEYLAECFNPIKDGEMPLTECQTDLFNVMERRHGLRFSNRQLNRVGEEIFFNRYIDERLSGLLKGDKQVRKKVKKRFKNKEHLIKYYRKIYRFRDE